MKKKELCCGRANQQSEVLQQWEACDVTVLYFVLFPAGGELLPGDEPDRRPAADVLERGRRLLGPVTAADQSEARHAR